MNKFLEFHDSWTKRERQYDRGTWEPLQMEQFRLLPFQKEVNAASDYTLYQVTDSGETDITSYMNGVTWTSDYILYDGSVLDNVLDRGVCHFRLENGSDYAYYSDDVCVGDVNGWLKGWSVSAGSPTISGKDITSLSQPSDEAKSNYFDVEKGETLRLIYERTSGSFAPSVSLYDSDGNLVAGLPSSSVGSVRVHTATIPKTLRNAYLLFRAGSGSDTITAKGFDLYKSYSDKMVKIKVSSSVDYGGVLYGSWEQEVYKKGNVRRSPRVESTQIGEERNGEVIIEKRISAVRYTFKCKVTEQEFEAFVHALSGELEITDQTGRVFDCKNVELSDPTWYQGNGIMELSFVDEINVYTLNN